jgi:hypothetical protein
MSFRGMGPRIGRKPFTKAKKPKAKKAKKPKVVVFNDDIPEDTPSLEDLGIELGSYES